MKHTKQLLFFCLLLNFNFNYLLAQDFGQKQIPLRLLLRGALEFGGDNVAEVYFTNGEKQSVKAGQGGTIAFGGELQVPGVERLLLQTTVGIKYVTTQADNAHIRLTRIPITFTANWMATRKLRLGAGVATHQGIRFKSGGLGNDVKFSGATGPMVEVAYSGIGLCYTAMNYKDEYNKTYAANAIGVSFTLTIPGR